MINIKLDSIVFLKKKLIGRRGMKIGKKNIKCMRHRTHTKSEGGFT